MHEFLRSPQFSRGRKSKSCFDGNPCYAGYTFVSRQDLANNTQNRYVQVVQCVCRNLNCAQRKRSVYTGWNSVSTFTELPDHGDERWPTEVTNVSSMSAGKPLMINGKFRFRVKPMAFDVTQDAYITRLGKAARMRSWYCGPSLWRFSCVGWLSKVPCWNGVHLGVKFDETPAVVFTQVFFAKWPDFRSVYRPVQCTGLREVSRGRRTRPVMRKSGTSHKIGIHHFAGIKSTLR